jgi:biotin carboxyl carrier protein
MVFDVDLNGRTCRVTVEPLAGTDRYRVRVEDRTYEVDVRWLDETTVSLRDERTGRVHVLGFAEAERAGGLIVSGGGRTFRAMINARRSGARAGETTRALGEQRLVAPMPGRIVRVFVQPGAEVRAADPLVVIEAMKMENELRAPKAGRVKDVAVQEGMSVEAGRLLVVVE